MPTLIALPPEILQAILSFDYSQGDLAALSRCCKFLHNEITPRLYEHVVMSARSFIDVFRIDRHFLYGALMRHTQSVRMRAHESSISIPDYFRIVPGNSLKAVDGLTDAERKCPMSALVRALQVLPQLSELSVMLGFHDVLDIPLEHVSAPMLVKLEILYCDIGCDSVGELLACMPALRHLRYDMWSVPLRGFSRLLDELTEALVPVSRTLEHLQVAVVMFSGDDKPYHDTNSLDLCLVEGSLGRLREMKSLRYLELPSMLLFGNDDGCMPGELLSQVMPKSMEHLCVRDDLAQMCDGPSRTVDIEQIRDMIEAKVKDETVAPQLAKLTIKWNHLTDENIDTAIAAGCEAIQNACTGAGIACNLLTRRDANDTRNWFTFA